MGKIIDITGQKFNELTALYPTRVKGRFAWHCRCSCGKETDIDSGNLRNGKVKSCGCLKSKLISESRIKDKTGQKIGYLTVLGPTEERDSGGVVWKCQCICGNITYVSTANLSNNHTRSCGCKTYEMVGEKLKLKLVGQKFGRLTVLQELETVNLESRWLCKCECGNQIESVGWHLTKGLVKSCGCLISHGEEKISSILRENNIEFTQQKTFDGCVSPNNVKLKFDFYIENKYLLEFDGSQHFLTEPNQRFSMEDIERIRQYDEIKNKWCKENNVPLIRIKYDQLKNLTIDDLLLKE